MEYVLTNDKSSCTTYFGMNDILVQTKFMRISFIHKVYFTNIISLQETCHLATAETVGKGLKSRWYRS